MTTRTHWVSQWWWCLQVAYQPWYRLGGSADQVDLRSKWVAAKLGQVWILHLLILQMLKSLVESDGNHLGRCITLFSRHWVAIHLAPEPADQIQPKSLFRNQDRETEPIIDTSTVFLSILRMLTNWEVAVSLCSVSLSLCFCSWTQFANRQSYPPKRGPTPCIAHLPSSK